MEATGTSVSNSIKIYPIGLRLCPSKDQLFDENLQSIINNSALFMCYQKKTTYT